MGYVFAMGDCFACHQLFQFNPHWVPSIRDAKGVKQPVCGTCMEKVNVKRKELKLPPHEIHPQAYEPGEE